ncbi:MAG: RNA-binding protein [Firmicutes bacterium]|nr:RNA-binding protein [Bacillota bacterium]
MRNPTTDKEDRLLLAAAEDKLQSCRQSNIMTHTAFLDSRQCLLVRDLSRRLGQEAVLFGGYEDAERRIAVFLPEYLTEDDLLGEDSPLAVLQVCVPRGSGSLSHRDYLGSLLATGIKREVTGDILVHENGAHIVILKDMSDFLLSSYVQAGRANLSSSVEPLSVLRSVAVKTEEVRDSVASVRLDAVCSSAFKMARGKAQEAILAGLVAVNGLQCIKPDFVPKEGDRISMRGKGKAILAEIGATSRKGRIAIVLRRFL